MEMLWYLTNIARDKENYNLVFGTMTLNEKYIAREDRTKAKLIDIWIQKHFVRALINKDYGDKTEREHYHFIAITKEPLKSTDKLSKKGFPLYNLQEKDYKLGHEPDIEIINWQDMDKLRNYLLKLNNHSTKITAKSRLRDIKNHEWKLFDLYTKKKANKYIKNATYDVLNKMSTSKVAENYVLTEEEIFELFS